MARKCLILISLLLSTTLTLSSFASISAEDILSATGVKGGLIVHIGCGDGGLTASLSANENYLVHRLDTGRDNIRTARQTIQSLGLYGIWGDRHWGRASGWAVASRYRPSGRILVADEETVFGYGRKNVGGNSLAGYQLFRADKKVQVVNKKIKNNNLAVEKYQTPDIVNHRWAREVPVVGRAMVLAENALFVAGPVLETGAAEPQFDDADSPAALMAFHIEDGTARALHSLDSQPVFDGMAAAEGRPYISTIDGKVVCLGKD